MTASISIILAMAVSGLSPTAPPRKGPDYVAVLVSRTFLRAIAEGDLKQAVSLCGPTVDFDGHTASNPTTIQKRIADLIHRFPDGYRFRTVVMMSYKQAVERFGPPPQRLNPSSLKGSVVAFGRLPYKGLVLFVSKRSGRWRVVAMSD